MVGAEGLGAVGEVLLEEGDGLVEPSRVAIGAGKVVACAKCIRLVGTQDVAGLSSRASESKG